MDLCEAEDYDGAEALNQVVDDLRARALKAEAEACTGGGARRRGGSAREAVGAVEQEGGGGRRGG